MGRKPHRLCGSDLNSAALTSTPNRYTAVRTNHSHKKKRGLFFGPEAWREETQGSPLPSSVFDDSCALIWNFPSVVLQKVGAALKTGRNHCRGKFFSVCYSNSRYVTRWWMRRGDDESPPLSRAALITASIFINMHLTRECVSLILLRLPVSLSSSHLSGAPSLQNKALIANINWNAITHQMRAVKRFSWPF